MSISDLLSDAPSETPRSGWSLVIEQARKGCRESFDLLTRGCWGYLIVAAREKLADDLRVKQAPSDLVQQTLMIAYANLDQFQGTTENELLRWFEKILDNQALAAGRFYRGTLARNINREVSFDHLPNNAGQDSTTPSQIVSEAEFRQQLEARLAELPERYQTVIHLRNREELGFEEIGERMGRSADAARKLWLAALRKLKQLMSCDDDSSIGTT